MEIVHWTTLRGLVEILDSMELYEETSFSSDLGYGIDQAHKAPFGLVFDTDDLADAGIYALPKGMRGVTAYEMIVERRNRKPVDLMRTPWARFIVRDEKHMRLLARILRWRGLVERIEVAV